MDWFKIHADTMIILGAFAASILWMNGKFNDIEKDITIMKNIMPVELAIKDKVSNSAG